MMDCGRDNCVECPDSGNYIEAGEVEVEACADADMVVNGTEKESKLRFECPGFKCKPGVRDCCCRRVLYTQPDFVAVESLLETHGHVQGFEVLLLPKFHCELNFIEQCWGYAKQKYREFPPSTKEADLERNLLAALEMVSLDKMCR